ncbi:GWxTD domain-containing protein [candidate division KSB1 bacterium]
MKKISGIFLFLIITCFISTTLPAQEVNFYYDEGARLKDSGNFEEAAQVWIQGARVLSMRDMIDPRIGIDLINMVTKNKMEDQYEIATLIYLWGYSSPDLFKYKDFIERDVEMILPLIPRDSRNDWKDLIKNEDTAIGRNVNKFWVESDPVQTTPLNERLVEHWERIHYARQNYTLGKNSVYGTDDRGLIFVKYGPPDQSITRKLFENSPEYIISPNVAQIVNYKRYQEITIWKYMNLSIERNVLFIFGEAENSGYGLRNGLDEFIPNSAYRGFTREIPPGILLQMQAYDQFRDFDPFFMQRFVEIQRQFNIYRYDSRMLREVRDRFIQEDRSNPDKLWGPQELSELDLYINSIEVMFTQSRILDDDNNPRIAIAAMSYIENPLTTELEEIVELSKIEKYTLLHSLIIRDSLMNEIDRNSEPPAALFENTSSFIIDHTRDKKHFTLAVEIFDPTRSRSLRESIESANMPYVGDRTFEVPEPLNTDMEQLELSDLVTGYKVSDELLNKNFPFPVIPGNEIPYGQNLQVYLEIYHLFLGSDNQAHYSIEFKVARAAETGLIARLRNRTNPEQLLSQSYTLDSNSRTAKENIMFDISTLEPGNYEFEVEITDLMSGQKKARMGDLKISK